MTDFHQASQQASGDTFSKMEEIQHLITHRGHGGEAPHLSKEGAESFLCRGSSMLQEKEKESLHFVFSQALTVLREVRKMDDHSVCYFLSALYLVLIFLVIPHVLPHTAFLG